VPDDPTVRRPEPPPAGDVDTDTDTGGTGSSAETDRDTGGAGTGGGRPPLPLSEMGGDPACWAGLVEDVRDAPAAEPPEGGPDAVTPA
jgi:hypothetical protein